MTVSLAIKDVGLTQHVIYVKDVFMIMIIRYWMRTILMRNIRSSHYIEKKGKYCLDEYFTLSPCMVYDQCELTI